MVELFEAWRRRWWHRDEAALARYANLRPLVVITGGSEGIGFALARRFARSGRDLLLVARTAAKLETARERLSAETDARVEILPLDVTATDALDRLDAGLTAAGAYADILVNCAGIGLSGAFAQHPPDAVDRLVALNVAALTRLTRHVLPAMLVRGDGGVLNLASIGAYAPGPHQAVYYASKAYVLSLTEAIAYETAGRGVRVCALAPGPVQTQFHARMGAQHAFYRYFVLPIEPDGAALAGYLGYRLGLRVVLPGLLNPLTAIAMRILPHRLLVPAIAFLLKPRG